MIPKPTVEQIASDAVKLYTLYDDKPVNSRFRVATNEPCYCRLWLKTERGFRYLGLCVHPSWHSLTEEIYP